MSSWSNFIPLPRQELVPVVAMVRSFQIPSTVQQYRGAESNVWLKSAELGEISFEHTDVVNPMLLSREPYSWKHLYLDDSLRLDTGSLAPGTVKWANGYVKATIGVANSRIKMDLLRGDAGLCQQKVKKPP
jgi:hypothetical protein